MTVAGFEPPPYPYDRLATLIAQAATLPGGVVDASVGTPSDDPPAEAVRALCSSVPAARGYPKSIGSDRFREGVAAWFDRRLEVQVDVPQIAACVGTKEFVASVPTILRLRRPDLDTVLYPAVSYPTYAMGATLAGCRAVPVALGVGGGLDLGSVDPADVRRALCLWVNSPGNPTGALDDLAAAARWGRHHGVPVFSDECYVEFTWEGPGRGADGTAGETILSEGVDGVVAVHSISKRSNLAGVRAGWYAGDSELVGYLSEVRKHWGLMPPGPVQEAAVVALSDQEHVNRQRDRYRHRLERLIGVMGAVGAQARMPQGAFYLWVPAPDGDPWGFAAALARRLGLVVSPGEFYGPPGAAHVRVAAVMPDAHLDLLDRRLEGSGNETGGGR